MVPHVGLEDPAGQAHVLVHGDLIGRVWSAALPLDDDRVSEAHVVVSLRDGQCQLIALRGRLAVDGAPAAHVALRPGMEVSLARGVTLRCPLHTAHALGGSVEGRKRKAKDQPARAAGFLGPLARRRAAVPQRR